MAGKQLVHEDGLILSPQDLPGGDSFKMHVENSPYSEKTVMSSNESSALHPQHSPQSRWLRWYYLILYAILIAVLSAVIGGLAAKSIVQNKPSNSNIANENNNNATNTTSDPSCAPITPGNPSPSPIFETEDKIYCPHTGSVNLTTEVGSTPYFLTCATDWRLDDVAPFFAANSSACIEACMAFNKLFDPATKCVGAGFQPTLTNRTRAQKVNNAPVNCWMKSDTVGKAAQKGNGEPVMALCLTESCT